MVSYYYFILEVHGVPRKITINSHNHLTSKFFFYYFSNGILADVTKGRFSEFPRKFFLMNI